MRRGHGAGPWKEIRKGAVFGHFVWKQSEQNFLGERLTPLDGSGSDSPQPGAMSTAWNSGRVGRWPSPHGTIPQDGRQPLRKPPGTTPPPGIHALG